MSYIYIFFGTLKYSWPERCPSATLSLRVSLRLSRHDNRVRVPNVAFREDVHWRANMANICHRRACVTNRLNKTWRSPALRPRRLTTGHSQRERSQVTVSAFQLRAQPSQPNLITGFGCKLAWITFQPKVHSTHRVRLKNMSKGVKNVSWWSTNTTEIEKNVIIFIQLSLVGLTYVFHIHYTVYSFPFSHLDPTPGVIGQEVDGRGHSGLHRVS